MSAREKPEGWSNRVGAKSFNTVNASTIFFYYLMACIGGGPLAHQRLDFSAQRVDLAI